MRKAKDWVIDNSQSGAFDTVESIAQATALVERIQDDAAGSFIGIVIRMKGLLSSFENTAWDGDPKRRVHCPLCITACSLIDEADRLIEL